MGQVWAILRDFNGHERWHPAVATSEIADGASGDQPGAVRDFRLNDGGHIREQLLALSDAENSFTYCVLEAPVQLRNYVAGVRLRRVTDDDSCLWEWRARFDPPASERERLTRFVADEIMEAGFQSVRRVLRHEQVCRFDMSGSLQHRQVLTHKYNRLLVIAQADQLLGVRIPILHLCYRY